MSRRIFRCSQPLVCWMLAGILLVGALLGAAPIGQPALAATATGSGAWTWPVDGELLTPFRNGDDPYAAGQHRGIDIAAPAGTPVRATTGGSVTYAGRLPDGAFCVTVRSADGRYLVSYLHLSSLAIKRGDSIGAGSTVGLSGTTGKRSVDAPHLHLSVRLTAGGAYVDPLTLLVPRAGKPVGTEEIDGAVTPLSAAPPAAGEIGARSGTQRARGQEPRDARTQTQTRARDLSGGNRVQRRQSHRRQTHVHAHSPGDSVAGERPETAGDSARESHVPRGRVAPPPFNAARTRLTAGTRGRDNGSYETLLASAPDSENTPSSHSSHPYLVIAAAAALLALGILLLRRRADAMRDPTDGAPEIVIARRDEPVPDTRVPVRLALHAVKH